MRPLIYFVLIVSVIMEGLVYPLPFSFAAVFLFIVAYGRKSLGLVIPAAFFLDLFTFSLLGLRMFFFTLLALFSELYLNKFSLDKNLPRGAFTVLLFLGYLVVFYRGINLKEVFMALAWQGLVIFVLKRAVEYELVSRKLKI